MCLSGSLERRILGSEWLRREVIKQLRGVDALVLTNLERNFLHQKTPETLVKWLHVSSSSGTSR